MRKFATALLIGLIAFSGTAYAQPKSKAKPAASSGKLTQSQVQQNPLTLLQQFTLTDLQAALADANAQTPPDTTSAQCYTALIALLNNPINNPLPTSPGAFLALQKARDLQTFLANINSPSGPLSALNIACAPLVLSVQNTLVQLGILTGAVVGTVGTGGLALPALAIPKL